MEKFFLSREDAVFVIIDIQERLANAMSDREKVVQNCLHLIEASKILEIPILLNEQYPKGLGPTVPEIRDSLQSYQPLEKVTFSCCNGENFIKHLRETGRKKVIVSGMETHVCVLQTCLDLIRSGYIVHIAGDAICSRTIENYRAGIEFMRDAGAVITCTETILFQLLEKAGTEEFKVISRRIK
jgi:isochorismate hydrolase